MKDILSAAGRRVLAEFVSSEALLAFDFDGTLAPIVASPQRAEMRRRTARLLKELASLSPCIVLSGRARPDVRRRLAGIRLKAIVGNHGAEGPQASRALARIVLRWQPRLRKRLAGLPGVWIEDKTFSTSVHYRGSRDKAQARAAIREAIGELGEVRIVGGKQVVNVLAKGAPHKGAALEKERRRLGCRTAIYVGDDETDEDVFALGRPGRLLTIRVGARAGSAAAYYVPSQPAMDELLRVVISCRRRP